MNPLIADYFAQRGWSPFSFQEETWAAYARCQSGLIHAPTGMGKTMAVWGGPLIEWTEEHPQHDAWLSIEPPPLRVLWITPLRALATDTFDSLREVLDALAMPWSIELRTGDTSSSIKQRQRKRLPTALITTPESISLLLSYPETHRLMAHLRCVVVDEWHELMGTKRGTQTELALARLRTWNPALRVWGLSATLGNLEQARDVLLPGMADAPLITSDVQKEVIVETLIPETLERFPWAGHIGLNLLPEVLNLTRSAESTILFTNTRAQTEIWFQALIDHAQDLIGATALHHGSLERTLRTEVENRLRDGRLRVVVSTSSLDLGVDFSPVDQVIQVGSPKGIARLLQRAGRSGHRPGATSAIACVPTHAFELVEFAAVKRALHAAPDGRPAVEARMAISKPLDVLVQHLVTIALGGGFRSEALLAEVRSSWAYRNLSDMEWQWALDFVTHGGPALGAYDQFSKVVEHDGHYAVESREIARFHRMSIGSITSAASMKVAYLSGANLGTIEESFVSRLRTGDRFIFAGRVLELVAVREMTAYVRKATTLRGIVPRWAGGRMPLSTQLAAAVRAELDAARRGIYEGPEMQAVKPLLELQQSWSRLPEPGRLLMERTKTSDGYHLFLFPLAGRLVHEGLAALLSYRVARAAPRTINAFATDYGVELLSPTPFKQDASAWRTLLSTENLLEDIITCVNTSELARRQFRDIARIAGLVFSGYPGSGKSTRQLQASSTILFDVFAQYDPDNLLIDQARREVLNDQLEVARLRILLEGIAEQTIDIVDTRRLTPLAFPLWADSLRAQEVTTERWEDRIKRMVVQLEAEANAS